MSKNINISIHGKVAVYGDVERIVCNNTDYVAVFDLSDSEFTTGRKFLQLITDKGLYPPIPFTGVECSLPAFTGEDGASVKIGIYEGSLSTTTAAVVELWESILSIEAPNAEATDEGSTAPLPVINDASDVGDDDVFYIIPANGEKSLVPVEVLKEVFGGDGGGGGGDTPAPTGDSYWQFNTETGELAPASGVEAISFEDLPLSGVDSLTFSDSQTAAKVQLLFAAPTTSTVPIEGVGGLAFSRGVWYLCTGRNGDNWEWSQIATLSDIFGRYIKPATGIPYEDLSPDVQASLDKADSALQQHQSLSGYATQAWVTQQGFLTSHQDISDKQNRYIGTADAGKFLVVGSDGNITAVTMTAWQGGSY